MSHADTSATIQDKDLSVAMSADREAPRFRSASTKRRSRRWLSSRALMVALAATGAAVCGTAWALSSPVGSSPDDTYHLTSIWCADPDDTAHCKPAAGGSVDVPAMVGGPSCFAFDNNVSGACQRTITGHLTTVTVNNGSYPGGFYRVMHVFVGDDDNIGVSVVAMRVFNVMVAVVLFTLLALAGTPATRRIQLYTLTCMLIPLGWFTIASVNPSSWAITGVTAYGFALHSFFVVGRRGKLALNGVLALLGAVVGISARADAGIYVVLASGALCLLHWRALRARWKLVALPVVCSLLGVLVALNTAQLSGVIGAAPETERTQAQALVYLLLDFPGLVSGMFGYGFGLGWLDTPLYSLTPFPVVLVLGYLLLRGAAWGSWRKAVTVVLLGGAMFGIPLLTLYRARLVVGEAVQPRYLLPIATVLLAVILTGRKPWQALRLDVVQAWIIWAMLTLANGAALYTNMRRYVQGNDDPVLITHREWWWQNAPSPVLTWLLGAVGFALFAAAIILVSGKRPLRRARVVAAASD